MEGLGSFIIKYWLEFLFAAFGGIMVAWCKKLQAKLKQKQKEQDALQQGMIALLHNQLKLLCNQYLSLGYIPVEDATEILDDVRKLYEAYHGIGGNGTGTTIYEKFKALPIKNPKED